MLRCFGCKSRNRSSRKHKTFSEATIITNVDSRATGQTPAVIGDSFAEQNGRTRRSSGQRTTSGKQPDQSLASFNIDYSSSRLSFQHVSPRTSYASACSDIFDIDPDSVGRDSVGTPQGGNRVADAPNVANFINLAEAAYAEGRIKQVQHHLIRATEVCGSTWQRMVQNGICAETGVSSTLDMRQVHQTVEELHICLLAAQDTSDFFGSVTEDMSIMYRHRKGDVSHSFRFEAIYDSPVSHLMAMNREFDLLSSWNKYSKDSAILAEIPPFQSVVYTAQYMPFPLTELDLVVHCQWSDVQEEGAVVITLRDYSEEIPSPDVKALPSRSSKRRRMKLLPGSASILQPYPCTADGRPRTKCIVVANLDPHVDYIPQFLVTFVLKVMSPFLYNATKRTLENNFSSPDMQLPRRMAACPEVYQRIDRRFPSPPHGAMPPPPITSRSGRSKS